MMATRATSKDFVISRVFDAPRDLVWACFSERDRLQQWWGPKGVEIVKAEQDFRVGGMLLYGMKNAAGDIMWGRKIYCEITPPERIVFINSFSDENGGLTRHPLAPQWPLQLLTVFTLEEQPGGKTKFTVRWTPMEPTAEEQAAFDAGHDSMTMGWSGGLDQLETYLAKAK
jgi:uncharacterized protein YndB with AHSA1/START domain